MSVLYFTVSIVLHWRSMNGCQLLSENKASAARKCSSSNVRQFLIHRTFVLVYEISDKNHGTAAVKQSYAGANEQRTDVRKCGRLGWQ